MNLLRRSAPVLICIVVAATACSSGDEDNAARPADPTPTAEVQALIDRLSTVRTADLVMGADFNRDLLRVSMSAIGLDDTEARCVAAAIETANGDRFATTPVESLFGADALSPDVLLGCLPIERVTQLGTGETLTDPASPELGELRSLLSGVAAAGYESAGLSAKESTCLASTTVSEFEPSALAGAFSSLGSIDAVDAGAVELCLSKERIVELVG